MARPGSAPPTRSLSAPSSGWELRVIKAKQRLDALQDAGVKAASWNSRDVGDWLEVIGFAQYRSKFIAQGVDGSVLLDLATTCQRQKKDVVIERRRMLEQLGIRNLAHQMQFMNKASELKTHEMSLNAEDSILETPGKNKTAALLEQHKKLQRRKSSVTHMQEVLDDLVKQSVFVNLQRDVDVLKMEGGSDLVKLSCDCMCKLKAKLADCKAKLLEEEKTINSEKVKALRSSDRWGTNLLAEVSPPPVSQQKALSTDQCDKLVERLFPDYPKKNEEDRKKRADQEQKEWKLRPKLSADQHEKLLERLHPVSLQADWRLRLGMSELHSPCHPEVPTCMTSKELDSEISGLEGPPAPPVHTVKRTMGMEPATIFDGAAPSCYRPSKSKSESSGW